MHFFLHIKRKVVMGLNQSIPATSKSQPVIQVESYFSPITVQRALEAVEDITRSDPEAICRDILQLFQLMEQWYPEYDGVSPQYVHGVLHRVAKVCFSQHLADSGLVCQLLEYVHEFGESYRSFVEKVQQDLMSENRDPFAVLKYFLQQANGARMRLGGRPFVDSFSLLTDFRFLAELEDINFHPALLKVFLQHGAMLPDRNVHAEILFRSCLQLLYHSCLVKSGHADEAEAVRRRDIYMRSEERATNVYEAVACMNVLLRQLRRIQIIKVGEWIVVLEGWSRVDRLEYDRYLRCLAGSGLCPAFRQRHFDPAELKHLCRYAIRERLWRYFKLPHAIFRLPLSQDLRAYLNLESD